MSPTRDPLRQPQGLLARILSDDKALCRFAFLMAILALLGLDARTVVGLITGAPSVSITSATPTPKPTVTP